MSRVYFHSPSGTAELRGSERAWLGGLVSDLALGMLDLRDIRHIDRLRELLHPDHYLHAYPMNPGPGHGPSWANSYATAFHIGWDDRTPLMQYAGKPISTFSLVLNTAALLGNDAIKLAARIHGQCEIHAWVDGPNRSWLAGIMQAGLDAGIYRKGFWFNDGPDGPRKWSDQGWGDVIALLQSRDDEPVVMSYSVCGGFPDYDIGDWMDRRPDGVDEDEHSEAWYDLDDAEKWRISMAGLRASGDGLELRPDDWGSFRFTHELSVLDLFADDWEERLQRAVGVESAAA